MRCRSKSQKQIQKPRPVNGNGSNLMKRWTEIGEIMTATVIMSLTMLITGTELVIGTIEMLTEVMRLMDGETGTIIATMIDQDTVAGTGGMEATAPATTMIMIGGDMIEDITAMMIIIMEAMATTAGEMTMMTITSVGDGAMIAIMTRIVQIWFFYFDLPLF